MANYKLKDVVIETREGLLTVKGWVNQDYRWNGWAVPMFDKENADKIAKAIGLRYDFATDTFLEPLEDLKVSGMTEEEGMKWKGYHSELVDEHVYDIGAAYWCWDDYESEYNNMHEALKEFVRYADILRDNWDRKYPTIRDGMYPDYLPSFDEFVIDMKSLVLHEGDIGLKRWRSTIK
jgi:hypothetical protein